MFNQILIKMENLLSLHSDGALPLLPPAAVMDLIERSEIMVFRKKEVVQESYEFSEFAYLIFDGLLLSYMQRGGEKMVKWVRGIGDFAFAQIVGHNLESKLTGQIIVALEETKVLRFSLGDLQWLQDKHPEIKLIASHHIHTFSNTDKWLAAHQNSSPKNKYDYVQNQIELNLDLVPDLYLASWLGITFDKLSGIRESW